jgi:RNase P protein component
MPETHTSLFATPCLGATIAHVHVFATHIRYEQKFGRDISVAGHMIASVEKRVYAYGFIILTTTSRRRIICAVERKRVERLYRAILRCTANNSPEVIERA